MPQTIRAGLPAVTYIRASALASVPDPLYLRDQDKPYRLQILSRPRTVCCASTLLLNPPVLTGELHQVLAQFDDCCPGELRGSSQEQFGYLRGEFGLREDLE